MTFGSRVFGAFGWWGWSLGILAMGAALPVSAAQFQFNTLVQLGEPGFSDANGWEVSMGSNNGTFALQGSLPTYWTSGASRQFQVIYDRPTNNMEVRIYNNGSTTAYAYGDITPAGTAPAANSFWRLPASSFFATDLTGGNAVSSISITGLALSGETGAALNVLAPIQQTAMTASGGPGVATQMVSQTQDIVFQGDATGSWRLSGFVTMNFGALTGSNYNRLQFGVAALSDVPEPSTWMMLGLGLAGLGAAKRRGLLARG